MKCPNCGAQAPDGALECAACGVIFAKLLKKIEELEVAPSAPFNPWIGRGLAAALVILWMLAFAVYYQERVEKLRAEHPPSLRPAP